MTHRMRTKRGTALLTGASSGIGLELARLFAGDQYDLVLVARNTMKLETLAKNLRAEYGIKVMTIIQELATPSAGQDIYDLLQRESIEIDVLVNNAGAQVYGEFATSRLEKQLALVQVNVSTLIHLTHLLLPGMLHRGQGRILNVGSTGSFAPGPLNAVYCATKAFVLSFSEALGAELAGAGVTVTALCPGATDTAFAARYNMEDVRIFRNPMTATRVARIGYRALRKGQPLVVAGFHNRLQVLAFQLMAPFLGLTPPAWLMSIGTIFMGRCCTKRTKVQQI